MGCDYELSSLTTIIGTDVMKNILLGNSSDRDNHYADELTGP